MTEIVRTRLRPPRPVAARIARPRAAAAFAAAADVPLVCVEADAGYGKTTFVDAVTTGAHRAWYALTPADRDPHTFLAHLTAAVTITREAAGDPPSPSGSWSALLDRALDRIDEWAAAGGTYIVLDDYHVVHGSPVDAVVGRLVDVLPARVQIVATSRTHLDPESWGGRNARYDAVRVIDRALLAFDDAETVAYLHSRFGVSLPPPVVEVLVEETEGWPIALSLIGRRLHRGHHSAEELLAALPAGRDAAFDFLGNQVFSEQPLDVQRFLLDVSVLSPLTPEACAAVADTTMEVAARTLRGIAAAGLFCAETDAGSYRMHHLFRHFLISQIDPARRRELHAAAARHHRAGGEYERAATHALASQQPEAAARDVAVIAGQLLASGRHLTLLALTDDLGPALDKHPALLVARSHAVRLSSRFDEAIDLAGRAAKLIGPQADAGDNLLGEALRAELAVHLDTVHPARAEQVLERLTAVGPHEQDLFAPRIENEINRGRLAHATRLLDRADDAQTAAALRPRLLVRQGRLLEARSLLERFTDDHSRIPMAHRESSALLAWMHALLGHADRAAEHARVGIGLGRDLRSPLLTCVSTGRLGLALITGSGPTDVRQAHQYLLESLELAERLGVDRFRAEPLMGLTVLADRMGRPEDTLRFGIDAVEILAAAGDRYLEAMARLAIGAALASRHDPTARTWLKESRELAHECGDALVPLLCDQWLASLDLAEGDRAAFAVRAQDVLTRTVQLNLTDIWLSPGWLGITDEAVRRAWLDAARAERCAAAHHAAHLQDRIGPPADGTTTTHPSPPAQQSVLRITTLSGFAVDRGGVTLTAESFGRRKAIEILLLLCASERHSQSRSELHDKLWPELSREKASVRFRVALHALHHVLEPDRAPREPTRFVRTSADRIWLDPRSVTIDADEFRVQADQLLTSAECDPTEGQKVLSTYQQPFLHDYPAFEWAISVRDELAVRFTELTLATAESLLEAGDHTAAIAACRRLLAHDPFVEPAYEVLAAARLAAGDSAGAHRAFHECERLFEEELDIRPTWTLDASGLHSVRHTVRSTGTSGRR
ncbi:BTAD domain-containing putative transcriptional regulator [Streptomyces sp. BH104]|uniref:BTAD domain-containing putative transcriptional regulator n=1 Tax=Streptomyces sp. BH104 TaxID=3410407 RepID=UPI003BB4BD5E